MGMAVIAHMGIATATALMVIVTGIVLMAIAIMAAAMDTEVDILPGTMLIALLLLTIHIPTHLQVMAPQMMFIMVQEMVVQGPQEILLAEVPLNLTI